MLTELLAEYWKLRRETGTFSFPLLVESFDHLDLDRRHIHGDSGQQIEHASDIGVMESRCYNIFIGCNQKLVRVTT